MRGRYRLNKDKVFYVYEWFDKDIGEVFYVGKGKGDRYKNIKQRNQYFINYYNKHNCDVRKIKEGLSEEEAFSLEVKLIADYKENGECKCNLTNGGEGATYDEGTWNYLFRSLQYSHDVRHGTAEMYNEEEYDSDNLKTKTTEELQKMYDDYNEFKERDRANRGLEFNIDIKIEEPLSYMELKMKNSEVKMLTNMFARQLSIENKKYKYYNKIKKEYDFYTSEIIWDDFLDEIINYGGDDYFLELVKCCNYNFRYLRYISNHPDSQLHYKLLSYNLKDDGFWHIRLQYSDTFKHFRVKLDFKDILMGILMELKELKLYEILNKELLVAPIYK